MPSTRTIQTSFSAGEISPQMLGRVDIRDYRNGAEVLQNLISKATGNARSRPGLRKVWDAYAQGDENPVRLIEFVYTNGDAYVVEVGSATIGPFPSYFRFFKNEQPLTWGEVVNLGPADQAFSSDGTMVELSERHQLVHGDLVYIDVEEPADMPAGLSGGLEYRVQIVDAFRFKMEIAAAPGPTVVVTVEPGNTAQIYVVKRGSLPRYPDPDDPLTQGQVYLIMDGVQTAALYVHNEGLLAQVDPFSDPTNVYAQPIDGVLTIGGPYGADDIFKINHTQSYDVLTLTRNGHDPLELRRTAVSPDRWVAEDLILAPPRAPESLAIGVDGINRGYPVNIDTWVTNANNNRLQLVTIGRHRFANGDVIYLDGVVVGNEVFPNGYAVVATPQGNIGTGRDYNMLQLQYYEDDSPPGALGGAYFLNPIGGTGASGRLYYVDVAGQLEHTYVVTAIYDDQAESEPSEPELEVLDVSLDVANARIPLQWDAVPDAVKYRVYKKGISGLFGFIGETEDPEFVDSNIGPDLLASPPELDDKIEFGSFDPQAVAYFEQRRVFASPTDGPQRLWLTNSGTESQFSYTIPIREDDRISVEFRSLQAQAVRHVLPIGELLVLTTTGEWRVTSINSDALTPLNISARQQSNNGTTYVLPLVMNDKVIYASARGGHLRELGFQRDSQGFTGGDLSFRAQHLFDDFEILDMARMQAPVPVAWIVSDSGALLGLTFVPNEDIAGFHRHTTQDGRFGSVACIPERTEDTVYVTVMRGGLRTIESMRIRERRPPDKQPSVDSHFTNLGSEYVHGNPGYERNEFARIEESDGIIGTVCALRFIVSEFSFRASAAPENIEDVVIVRAATTVGIDPFRPEYRMRVLEYISNSHVRAELLDQIPTDLLNTPVEYGISQIRAHVDPEFEGKTVSVVLDGVAGERVVKDGFVEFHATASRHAIGLPFVPELHTLPLFAQIDAAGHGRAKNINRVWLRVFEASPGVYVGPTEDCLVPVEGLEGSETHADAQTQQMLRTTILPSWNEDGKIIIRQTLPFPMTVLGLVLEAEFGD